MLGVVSGQLRFRVLLVSQNFDEDEDQTFLRQFACGYRESQNDQGGALGENVS